ncbi:MAG: hypothetical protein ACLTK0_00285 [Anaerovoracaceae bacterium]
MPRQKFAPLYDIDEEAAGTNGALTYYGYLNGFIKAGDDCRFVQGENEQTIADSPATSTSGEENGRQKTARQKTTNFLLHTGRRQCCNTGGG